MKGKTLMDLQLTPSSVFYIKWEDDELSSESPTAATLKSPAFADSPGSRTRSLRPPLLASAGTTPPPLVPALLGAAAELPIAPAFDPRKEQAPAEAAVPKAKTQKLGFGGASGKVTPSWLKLGKSGKK